MMVCYSVMRSHGITNEFWQAVRATWWQGTRQSCVRPYRLLAAHSAWQHIQLRLTFYITQHVLAKLDPYCSAIDKDTFGQATTLPTGEHHVD